MFNLSIILERKHFSICFSY